jgi:hypothetical protein
MRRKEWLDLLRQSLFFVVVVSLQPVFLILFRITPNASYLDVFFPVCQFSLFFLAVFLGASFLASERYQGAMTYMLTLPLSRLRLLRIKLMPRLVAALGFFLLFNLLLLAWGKDSTVLPLFAFPLVYFSLFFISLSLSACSENFLVLFFLSLFSLMVFLGMNILVVQAALKFRGYSLPDLVPVDFFVGDADMFLLRFIPFVAGFLILPAVLSFILSFRRLDVRPTRGFNKRFFRYLAPLMFLGLIGSMVSAYSGLHIRYRTYHLTRDHKLIESHFYSDVKVYDEKGMRKIENFRDYCWDCFEINGEVYGLREYGTDQIVRIDPSEYTQEIVYRCNPGWKFHHRIMHQGRSLIFLTRKHDYTAKQLEILKVDSGDLAVIPLTPEILSPVSNEEIIAADEAGGRRFWLMLVRRNYQGLKIVRIWEDGETEQIAESTKRPCYVNGMLMTYTEDEILLSREKDGLFAAVHRIPNPSGFGFGAYYSHKQDLNNVLISELYGLKRVPQEETGGSRLFARLDLECLVIQEIGRFRGRPHFIGNDTHLYFDEEIESGRPVFKAYRLRRGELEHLRSFPGVRRVEEDFERRVDVLTQGLVIVQGTKVDVFAFPDLRELEFKKLR